MLRSSRSPETVKNLLGVCDYQGVRQRTHCAGQVPQKWPINYIVTCVNDYQQHDHHCDCRRPNMEMKRLDSTGQDECSWADRDEIGEDEDVFAAIK